MDRATIKLPREAMADVLTRIEVRVLTTGPAAGKIDAYQMADAVLHGLLQEGYRLTRFKEDGVVSNGNGSVSTSNYSR